MSRIDIRIAEEADFEGIWNIFSQVVQAGDTYSFAPETSKEEARALWMAPGIDTYVAVDEGHIHGTYMMKPNQPGLGSHVANAGFMVDPEWQGRGMGSAMCGHALEEAKKMGYSAMQFNYVVSTNKSAIALWERFGFEIVGTIPRAFKHFEKGFVDAHVMYREL